MFKKPVQVSNMRRTIPKLVLFMLTGFEKREKNFIYKTMVRQKPKYCF